MCIDATSNKKMKKRTIENEDVVEFVVASYT